MSVGGGDLAQLALMLLIGVLVLGAITLALVAIAKRRGSPSLALELTRMLSILWLVVCAIGVPLAVYSALIAPSVVVEAPGILAGASPCGAAGEASDDPSVACATSGAWASEASVEVPGLGFGIRSLLFLGQLLRIAVFAAPAAALAVLARAALAGTPFTRQAVRTTTIVAIVIAAGGILQEVLLEIGRAFAVRAADLGLPDDLPVSLSLPLWPLAAGVGVAGLAAVLRHGERLQRDTEGLV